MKLFDLHCDTIERMEELGENMLTDKTQLSLKYLPQIEKWCQTFAIFIPDSKRGADAVSYYEQVLAYFHKMLEKHADIVEMANTADDIRRITGSHKCAALLSVEGGAVLDGKLENIEKLKKEQPRYFAADVKPGAGPADPPKDQPPAPKVDPNDRLGNLIEQINNAPEVK